MTERGQYFGEQELMRHILPPDFTGLLFREPLMLNRIVQHCPRIVDAWQIPSSLIAEMPASVALHYAVLPLRLENDELIVGSEDGIDPVSLAALTRKVGRKVRYVIVLRGQIVTGLRHWYARRRGHDPRAMLYNARCFIPRDATWIAVLKYLF